MTVAFNQIIISIAAAVLMSYAMQWRGCGFTPEELPSFWRILFDYFICLLGQEVGFYYTHR
jgi:sterol desaturase/sphingolipid hydroxylase (fatty acid hydroxylase superfamily)